EGYLIFIDQMSFDHKLSEGDDRMAAHRAVTLVVQKEDVEIGISRWSNDSAIHICMTTRLPHQTSAQIVVVFTKITSLFEHVPALNRRQSTNDNPQRLATRMHVDCRDARPVLRRFPVGELIHCGQNCSHR